MSNNRGEQSKANARWVDRLNANIRLLISAMAICLTFFVISPEIHLISRLLIAWDVGVLFFLFLAWSVVYKADPEATCSSTQNQDQSGTTILWLTVITSCATLIAIGFVLRNATELPEDLAVWYVLLAGCTVICSWFFMHTMFALHYAHMYYYKGKKAPKSDFARGLDFPGDDYLAYWDFIYFSFVIGMTFQVSDVKVLSGPMRRVALTHALISFGFNTVILAMSINIISALIL